MKKQLVSILILIICVVFSGTTVMAQGVIVYKKDGGQIKVPYANLDSVVTYCQQEEVVQNEVIQGHECVDLGLSVKWATCNVGADSPEDYGDYFAWGETSTKSEFTYETYRWTEYDDKNYEWEYTKYCTNSDEGKYDGKDVLTTSDDAATVKWGSKWRMPTKEEQEELVKKCTFTLSSPNGVLGCKVTGPNGNSIFLPFTGYIEGITPKERGEQGYYWSKSLDNDYNWGAESFQVYIYNDHATGSVYWSESRKYGLTIRPVTIH